MVVLFRSGRLSRRRYRPQRRYGQLTQLVECHLDVVKVGGSSPSLPTGAANDQQLRINNAGLLLYIKEML